MDRSLKELMIEYGDEGNVETGNNCIIYNVNEAYIKINEDFPAEKVEDYKEVLDDIGVPYPETEAWESDIKYYDIGEATVVEQEEVEPAIPEIAENPGRYVNDVREMGLKAAANEVKIDIGLDNLVFVDGELGVADLSDHEALWTDEHLALHLMGSYLLRSVEKYEEEEDLYAPGLKELGERWWGAV